MVTLNQDGIVPVDAVHSRVMATHEKVREFQQAVRASVGTQADRDTIYRQFEGWLHDLKFLTLIAYRYKAHHDFFNRISNLFDDSDECLAGATDEQKFQNANNLVITAVRLDLETFHIYTSTFLDRIVRIFPAFFGEKNAVKTNTHEKFWKQVKHRPEITYVTPTLTTEASWLQNNVDWFRNRVIVHPEGYEAEGYYMRGVKSRQKQNLRTFARARVPTPRATCRKSTRRAKRSRPSSSTCAGTSKPSSTCSTRTTLSPFSKIRVGRAPSASSDRKTITAPRASIPAVHPDTREVAGHMRDFGLTVLGRAAYQCTFSDLGAPYGHAMAVGFAAHGAELVIKARIADEHPLLIFDTLPKAGSTKDMLSIKELFENGRTVQYNELPEALWAATGIRMERIDQYQKFGRYRNTIMHFAVPAEDWSAITLEFLMQVVEPLVQQFWEESLISYIDTWDEVTVSEGYFEGALNRRGIEITPAIRAAIDDCIPDAYKGSYKPQ